MKITAGNVIRIYICSLIYIYRFIEEFYNDNELSPVFDWQPKNKRRADILKILLKPMSDTTTFQVPPQNISHNISHNVCFLIDTSSLESPNDWKCNDMGAWKNNKVHREYLSLLSNGDVVTVNKDEGTYTLKRVYYADKLSKDLTKIASSLLG